mgnify:CR=1 FL=1
MKEQNLRTIIRKEIRSALSEKVSATLTTKMDRVDKTQEMGMLKKTLATKPATQQVDFIIAMIQGFELQDAAKSRLILKMRQALK